MDVFKAIQTRRSVREFLAEKIPKEDLEIILNMGRFAPTAGNIQPWKFFLLKNMNRKEKFRSILEENICQKIKKLEINEEEKDRRKKNIKEALKRIFNAPIIILLFVDANTYPDLVIYDGALAAQNILLATHALGYGSSFQTSFFPEQDVKDFFSIPEHFKFICALPIGKAVQQPKMPEKRPLETFIWKD
jgi:nitroreductase